MKISFKQIVYLLAWGTFVTCMGVALFLPNLMDTYFKTANNELMIFLYVTFIPFIPLLWSVIKLSHMLKVGEPFSYLSLRLLRRISFCAMVDCLLYMGGAIYFKQFIYFLMIVVTLLISLIGLIISELIKNGIELKEENELTI